MNQDSALYFTVHAERAESIFSKCAPTLASGPPLRNLLPSIIARSGGGQRLPCRLVHVGNNEQFGTWQAQMAWCMGRAHSARSAQGLIDSQVIKRAKTNLSVLSCSPIRICPAVPVRHTREIIIKQLLRVTKKCTVQRFWRGSYEARSTLLFCLHKIDRKLILWCISSISAW